MGNAADRMALIKLLRARRVKFAPGSMFGDPSNVSRRQRILLDAEDALKL
jgi:hypothetical protein